MPVKTKLKKLIQEYYSFKLAKTHLKNLKTKKKECELKLAQIEKYVDQSYTALSKKERRMNSLFGKILAKKGSALENQQYLKSVLHFNECIDSLELIEFEIGILKTKISNNLNIEKELKEFLKNEVDALIKIKPKLGRRIKAAHNKYKHTIGLLKEIDEALTSGLVARKEINKLLSVLRKASRTEIWGKSFVETQKKKKNKFSLIDKSTAKSVKTKMLLLKFEAELKDVFKVKGLKYYSEYSEFEQFTAIYYDNLITDWVLSKKIINVILNVETVRDIVNLQLRALRSDKTKARKEIEKIDNEINRIINSKTLLK